MSSSEDARAQASRLQVLSVAVGNKLGLKTQVLRQLAKEATLVASGREPVSPILKLVASFDRRAFQSGGSRQSALRYFRDKGRKEFGEELVDALLDVQDLIQPLNRG